jgi:hypothetical protein
MGCTWGRQHATNSYGYLAVTLHRSRFNNFFLVQCQDPKAPLCQKAHGLLLMLHSSPTEPLYRVMPATASSMPSGSRWVTSARHVVISPKGTETKILVIMTDNPELSGAELIPTYEKGWPLDIAWHWPTFGAEENL